MFSDPAMTGRFHISAVNSINWARLMAQVVYYFAAALQLGAPQRKVAFAVPTGNFGDVFAGYVAAQMGLPIERLIVATNVNDILHRALSTATIRPGRSRPTAAPSMDIQVSSNFERLLFDCGGRDGAALAEQMRGFEATQGDAPAPMPSAKARRRCSPAPAPMPTTWRRRCAGPTTQCGEVIDPHTAIGLHAARAAGIDPSSPGGDAGDRPSGQVPRRGRARDRHAPGAARARRRPVRARGALCRASRRRTRRSPPMSRSTRRCQWPS